ncbi:unnamed protein product, partial [Iphiclides podalirius]
MAEDDVVNVSASNEGENQNNPNKRKWRKKRKNFLSNAKKYAKKGQMGRGTQMPEELYQYFVGILEAIKAGIEDEEQKQALVNNVLDRTKGEELNIVGNQLGCRVIELLLPYAIPEDLERYIEVLTPDLRRLCADNFSNHVLKTVLKVCCKRATEHLQTEEPNAGSDSDDDETPKKKRKVKSESQSKYSKEHIKVCHDFTLKISKYALNNLEDFVWDTYANHIVRASLKCLSGITLLPGEKPKVNLFKEPVLQNKGIPPHQTKMQYRVIPEDFKELVKEFANRLSLWPQFKDLPYETMTSALLQVLLFAVKNVDKTLTRHLLKKLLNESFAPDDWVSDSADSKKDKDTEEKNENGEMEINVESANLPPVFKSEPSVRLLEAALFVAKKKMYTQIYAKCFINRLGQLANMPMLNFTVQRLIDNCQIKEEFEPMFEELSGGFGALLVCGNTGVLVALAKACLRLQTKQAQYLQNLEAALQCGDDDGQQHFAASCLRLVPYSPSAEIRDNFIHIHGSVIMQTMLDFQRPAKVVTSLLSMDTERLVATLSDAKGCHLADALRKGRQVGAKSRDRLVAKLEGHVQQLALCQYGSRALEQLFEGASAERQLALMQQLSEKAGLLNGSPYGRIVAAKLDVATFKRSPKSWQKARARSDK